MPFALADLINTWIVQFKFERRRSETTSSLITRSLDDDRCAFQPVLARKGDASDARIHHSSPASIPTSAVGIEARHVARRVGLDAPTSGRARSAPAGRRPRALRAHASVDDALYDPRAGLGIFYRWAPRDVADYCEKSGFPPCIHISVAERIAHGTADYAPGNIPPDVSIHFTPIDARDPKREIQEALLKKRADALEDAITPPPRVTTS
jgi:hypothetical protein